jgi:hypothetical protein
MAEKPQIAPFSAERRARRRAARRAADKRLRTVARLRHFFGWVTAAAFVLFWAANMSLFSRDSLHQLGSIITAGLDHADAGTLIQYATENTATVSAYADGLAVADSDVFNLQKPGAVQLTEPLGYSSPTLLSNEHYVFAYDRGGYSAMLTTSISVTSKVTLESPIITGCLGQNGDYALITNETGYKSAVTVFSANGEQRFKWATPDYYFESAALSPDGRRLAVAAFSQTETEFEGTLFFRDLGSEEISSQVSLGSTVPLAAGFLDGDTAAVVGDYGTFIVSRKGETIKSIGYAADDLDAYCFGEGSLVLGTHSYSGKARTSLSIFDAEGAETGPLLAAEDLQAIGYDGARLALLTASGLRVYDSALRPLWENASAAGARAILLNADGSVWAAYSKQADRLSASSDTSEALKS